MSDILPKLKTYFFICVISFFINLSVVFTKMAFKTSDLGGLTVDFLGASLGSAVPFVNLTILLNSGFPNELTIVISSIFVIISGIEVFLIAMFALQIVSNLIWHPDV